MKHPSSRMLFAYWDSLRAERSAPERGEIRAGAMRHILADAFILANEGGAFFRLAGSRISTLFCRELAGVAFDRLWTDNDRATVGELFDLAVQDTVGLVIGAVGRNANGSEIPLEMTLLPLRHRGRADIRLIGALSPSSIPSWAGLVPLAELDLRTFRIVDGHRSPDDGPPRLQRPGRERFIVHDGGSA